MRQIDLSGCFPVDVEAKEIFKVSLSGNFESTFLHLLDGMCDSLFTRSGKDTVISIQYIYHIFLVKDTFVDDRLVETDIAKFGAQVLVQHMTCLLLSVCVLLNLENITTPWYSLNLKPLWDLHKQVSADRRLGESEYIVKLIGVSVVYQDKDEKEPGCVPDYNKGVHLVVVTFVYHAVTVDVESSLPFVHFAGFDVTLAIHLLHGWEQGGGFWVFNDMYQFKYYTSKLHVHLTPH